MRGKHDKERELFFTFENFGANSARCERYEFGANCKDAYDNLDQFR